MSSAFLLRTDVVIPTRFTELYALVKAKTRPLASPRAATGRASRLPGTLPHRRACPNPLCRGGGNLQDHPYGRGGAGGYRRPRTPGPVGRGALYPAHPARGRQRHAGRERGAGRGRGPHPRLPRAAGGGRGAAHDTGRGGADVPRRERRGGRPRAPAAAGSVERRVLHGRRDGGGERGGVAVAQVRRRASMGERAVIRHG